MKYSILFLTLILVCFWKNDYTEAAGISSESHGFFDNGQKLYEVRVYLDADGENINAVSGELRYPEKDLSFEKIMDGSSAVNFWVKSPQKTSDGLISFSGGIPGGYALDKGFLFSVIFSRRPESSATDQVELPLTNLEVYLDDGSGTQKNVSDEKISLNLENVQTTTTPQDKKPPEVFAPYVIRDPNLAGGLWVIILNAQDKGAGVDHYEIFESIEKYQSEEIINNKNLPWQVIENPASYVLHDQNLESYVYVKAVDRAGNERVAIVIPSRVERSGHYDYKIISIVTILTFALVIILLELFFFRRRKYV